MRSPIIVLAAIATLAACAGQSQQSQTTKQRKDTCVFFSALYDWQALDDSNLVVWVPGKNDAYQMVLSMPLMGLKFANTLGFVDGTQDGRLCSFGRDAITLDDHAMPQRSTIRSIERLDAAALTQLEEKFKVKLKPESKRKAPPKTPDRQTAQ